MLLIFLTKEINRGTQLYCATASRYNDFLLRVLEMEILLPANDFYNNKKKITFDGTFKEIDCNGNFINFEIPFAITYFYLDETEP